MVPAVRGRWAWRIAGLAIVVLIGLWQLWAWRSASAGNVLERIDAVLYDWRFQAFTPARPSLLPLVIVDLDEATQQREGRWPWDRAKVAQLIQSLRAHGAALIGFDVVFSEAVENPVQRLLNTGQLPADLQDALLAQEQDFDGDAILAASLAADTVLGFFLHADGFSAGQLPPPLLHLDEAQNTASTLGAMPNFTASLPLLADSGANSGFVVAIPDADGIMRRVPLLMRHGDEVYAALALELARLALGAPWLRLEQARRDAQLVVTGVSLGKQLRIPLDESGSMLVPYKGGAFSYTTLSATKVLRGDAPARQLQSLQGAIVLVGTSALGLSDLRSTPLQTGYPGVEAHVNVLDAILQTALGEPSLYQQPDWANGAVLLLLLGFGLALGLGLPGRSPWLTVGASLVALLLLLGGNVWLWQVQHLALPLAAPILLVLALAALNFVGGFWLANRQRSVIQNLFGAYVPPAHVTRMLDQPELLQEAGELRVMTVLFADVRNFTAISEHLTASELKYILNRYLNAVTEEIFACQGTIDKYVGDMVMAFWNAPLEDLHHASHAVEAALAIQRRMEVVRAEFSAEGLPQMFMGIGLNTGPMNVGDMGSKYRRAYTVLGDAVNLGSRIEGLTAFYGVPVLASDSVRQQAPGFVWRLVDRVRVKGRAEVLDLSQPLAAQEQADQALQERAIQFENAVAQYQLRNWDIARSAFMEISQRYPADARLCELYLQRMQAMGGADLPSNWQAVYDHTHK